MPNVRFCGPGLDDIHALYIKALSDIISFAFAQIANWVIKTVVFSSRDEKKSRMNPVFRERGKALLGNYHRGSVLYCLVKYLKLNATMPFKQPLQI